MNPCSLRMERQCISKMLRIFFACLLIFLAPYAQAKFTMPKYNFALKILATDELRSDLNWIHYRFQNESGPKLAKEYAQKLQAAKPAMHPDDVTLNADKRKAAYFKQSIADVTTLTKAMRDREVMAMIDAFEEPDMQRIKQFVEAYPKISNILLNYDHYRTLLNEVHAIYTADHKQKWEIASDITIGMLENKPLYVDFSDKKAENRFSNNVVNYLTNNFELRQLGIIKEFFGSTLGKKYITTVIALYNERYHTVEEIYKKNYPVFAEP